MLEAIYRWVTIQAIVVEGGASVQTIPQDSLYSVSALIKGASGCLSASNIHNISPSASNAWTHLQQPVWLVIIAAGVTALFTVAVAQGPGLATNQHLYHHETLPGFNSSVYVMLCRAVWQCAVLTYWPR
jgi:hypothetical protein